MEDYAGNTTENLNYIYRRNDYGDELVTWEDGFKNLVNGIVANPVAYLARTTNNQDGASWGAVPGPGSNPFLGHLKFGFNTPYINNGKATFYIGFDCTADSLTAGHFLALTLMKRLQLAGNKPIALIGGGTS